MTKKYILIILALSLLTRFAFFGYPAETVFDEVHFGKFVSGYFTGQYFFDIHPPLGKLMIAGMAKISGFEPGFSFESIGQKFADDSYKWLRFLPKLAGALIPALIFLIALELGISQKFAFLTGLLLIFENSLLAQSRFILLDSFLLLFGFSGILFFLKSGTINFTRSSVTNSNKKYLFLSGLFSSLAFSVKWTGLSFLALILIFYFWSWLKSDQKLKQGVNSLIFLILIPFIIYFSIFAVHFSLLDKPGPGLAFHPPNFQEINIFKKFAGLNLELYKSNTRLGAGHPYTSKWFQWPFMNKPIYYWNSPSFAEASEGTVARIYFLGNPFIWWLSTIAVAISIKYLVLSIKGFKKSLFSKKLYLIPNTLYFILTGFFLNWLPFIFIGRVMFLYHYLASLIFAILILCFQLDKLKNERGGPTGGPPSPGMTMRTAGVRKDRTPPLFYVILAGSIILFLFFSPLTYGLAIPEWYYKLMIWLPAWR